MRAHRIGVSQWRGRISLTVIAALVVAAACREVELMGSDTQFPWGTGEVRQLTYNTGRDGGPAWTPNGDSIFYSAQAFPGVVGDSGVLLAIPAQGGTARSVYPFLHAPEIGGPAFHVAPAVSPDGERIAFIDITRMAAPSACIGDGGCPGVEPLLETGRIVVRDRNENSSTASIVHDFVFPGRAPQGGTMDRAFEYIADFQNDGRVNFSIAWAPDAQRLVFSDGTRLYLWQPGSGAAPQLVPNTAFGVHPTWSSDGELIAFARVTPIDSTDVSCSCGTGGRPRTLTRRVYNGHRSVITVIRPDGTPVAELGTGVDPAFGADGALYASSSGRIVRIDVASGTTTEVPGTQSGYAPAPSPDGSELAFMKRINGGYDLWVVELGTR